MSDVMWYGCKLCSTCARFVYHKLSSIKIDNKIMCPLEALDLSDYISGPVSSELVYDLQSCVCHFGGS